MAKFKLSVQNEDGKGTKVPFVLRRTKEILRLLEKAKERKLIVVITDIIEEKRGLGEGGIEEWMADENE